MKKWEDFENEMTSYLKEMLHDYDVIVKQYGNSNSTIPDIEITINSNNKKTYIETKMPVSQTSQFVVDIENDKFIYSNNNKFKSNEFSKEIIKILNDNFNLYKNVAQKGLNIPVPKEIAFGWIVTNMKNKKVEFIISIDNKGNKKIFSLDHFNDFFNVKTIIRRKKSGSQKLPKTYYEDFKKHLKLKFSKYKYSLYLENNKLFIKLPLDLEKKESYLDSDLLPEGKKYYLSNKGCGKYEAKITSATNNPNIIFELTAKKEDFDMYIIQCLIDYINENR